MLTSFITGSFIFDELVTMNVAVESILRYPASRLLTRILTNEFRLSSHIIKRIVEKINTKL